MNTDNQAGVWRLHNDKNWQVRIKAEVEKTFKNAGIINFTNSEFISTLEVLVDNIEASFKRGESPHPSAEAASESRELIKGVTASLEKNALFLDTWEDNATCVIEYLNSINALKSTHPSPDAESFAEYIGENYWQYEPAIKIWGSRLKERKTTRELYQGFKHSHDAGTHSDRPLSHAGQRLVDKQLEERAKEAIPELKHIINSVSEARKIWEEGFLAGAATHPSPDAEYSLKDIKHPNPDYNDEPGIYHQPLFNLMVNDHGLTLLNSEMDEIIRVVIKMIEPSPATLEEKAKELYPYIEYLPEVNGMEKSEYDMTYRHICDAIDTRRSDFLAGANYILKQQKGE